MSCHRPRILEAVGIVNCCLEGQAHDRSYARDRHQTLADVVLAGHLRKLTIKQSLLCGRCARQARLEQAYATSPEFMDCATHLLLVARSRRAAAPKPGVVVSTSHRRLLSGSILAA